MDYTSILRTVSGLELLNDFSKLGIFHLQDGGPRRVLYISGFIPRGKPMKTTHGFFIGLGLGFVITTFYN